MSGASVCATQDRRFGGDSAKICEQVWGLGVVLFILLLGYPPFPHDATAAARIRTGAWQLGDELDAPALDLLTRMLRVDRAQRASMAEVLVKSRNILRNAIVRGAIKSLCR